MTLRTSILTLTAVLSAATISVFASGISGDFELHSGFVVVTAQVDGQAGTYILDSGAPGRVLNARHCRGAKAGIVEVSGTGGTRKAGLVEVRIFQWGNFEKADFEAIVVDGGSTDQTVRIARTFAGPNDTVIVEPDAGQADAGRSAHE